MKVISSFRQAALTLPLLAATLFAGAALTGASDTVKANTVIAVQLAGKPAPAPENGGTVHTNGSMVAWAG